MAERNKDVGRWMSRIGKAQAKRKEQESQWDKNYKAVYGDDWFKDGKKDGTPTGLIPSTVTKYDFDLLLSFLKTELPTLVLTRPEVLLNASKASLAKNPNAQSEAKIIESRTNEILADMDGIETEIRVMLADAHIAYAIQKTLPRYSFEAHPQAGEAVTDKETGEALLDSESGEPLTYPDEVLGSPAYDICRVDPYKFLIDERAKNNPYKASWMGEEIDRTLEEIKIEGMYDLLLVGRLETEVRKKEGKDKADWEIELKLYEIYDRTHDKIIVICEQYQDDFLRNERIPEGIEKDPYTILKFTEIPGQWFPKAEVTSGRVQQDEYRQGREWQREWAKKANPQLGVKQSFAESLPEEAKKLGDGVSNVVKVTSESDVFMLNKDAAHVNVSLEEHMGMCMRDFDQTMGQSSQDRGLTGEAKFATEAQIAENQGNIREHDKLQMVKSFFSRGIEKLLLLIQHNPAESEEIRALVINTDIDMEIDIESKNPKNKAIERKQKIDLLTVYPELRTSKTFITSLMNDFDEHEIDAIMQEVAQAAQAANPQAPQEPGVKASASISFKGELLPTAAQDYILDQIMKGNVPMDGAKVAAGGNGQPATTESPAAGTEGMSPGSGQMPQIGGV